jgi:hypothetical protein
MSMFGRRGDPAQAAEVPEVEAPAFLRQQDPGIADVRLPMRHAPQPARRDPLDPRAAKLVSRAIIDAAQKYVEEVQRAVAAAKAEGDALDANARAWGEAEVARATARAEDIASAHADILRRRDAFFAGPASGASAPEKAPPAEPTQDAEARLHDLARRLEGLRPQELEDRDNGA